mmetsp:Transcript_99886/g.285581  ORF Transcript_99886/g.285581 Transcript_99886/m.285581 type:complete len:223 (-) Transcript_99886:492-1160(-)
MLNHMRVCRVFWVRRTEPVVPEEGRLSRPLIAVLEVVDGVVPVRRREARIDGLERLFEHEGERAVRAEEDVRVVVDGATVESHLVHVHARHLLVIDELLTVQFEALRHRKPVDFLESIQVARTIVVVELAHLAPHVTAEDFGLERPVGRGRHQGVPLARVRKGGLDGRAGGTLEKSHFATVCLGIHLSRLWCVRDCPNHLLVGAQAHNSEVGGAVRLREGRP